MVSPSALADSKVKGRRSSPRHSVNAANVSAPVTTCQLRLLRLLAEPSSLLPYRPRPLSPSSCQTQLENLEELVSAEGPFLAGADLSVADATVWPTMNFIRFMMPKFDRDESVFLGPKLTAWCKHMDNHPTAKR